MNITALYKTFDGGEFVDASLASIYDHVQAIVMVHSDMSWLGERGNTVKEKAIEWCRRHDSAGKVHHVDANHNKQEAQYAVGISYIEEHKLPCDVLMVVDCDEVWEGQYIENARQQIHDNPDFQGYRCNMQTYLKTPFYQVWEPFGSPTAFLRDFKRLILSPRGSKCMAMQLDNVWMHHYTYVRKSREDVKRKIHQSCHADGGEVVIPDWMETVYDRLPEGKDLHSFKRWAHVWQSIRKMWVSDLPPAMRNAELLPLWMPFGDSLMEGEMNAIHRLCKGRGQAVDLGTFQGLSAATLALSCRRVHTVDCYEDLPADAYADVLHPERYRVVISKNVHSIGRTQALSERYGNITCEKNHTVAAAQHWDKGGVDVLFVDADHSEKGTLENLEAWSRHLLSGALVILHDNNEIHPGVRRVVQKLRSSPQFKFVDAGEYSGSLAAFEFQS